MCVLPMRIVGGVGRPAVEPAGLGASTLGVSSWTLRRRCAASQRHRRRTHQAIQPGGAPRHRRGRVGVARGRFDGTRANGLPSAPARAGVAVAIAGWAWQPAWRPSSAALCSAALGTAFPAPRTGPPPLSASARTAEHRAACGGSDRGQSGVRPGSERGSTPGRPGSDPDGDVDAGPAFAPGALRRGRPAFAPGALPARQAAFAPGALRRGRPSRPRAVPERATWRGVTVQQI